MSPSIGISAHTIRPLTQSIKPKRVSASVETLLSSRFQEERGVKLSLICRDVRLCLCMNEYGRHDSSAGNDQNPMPIKRLCTNTHISITCCSPTARRTHIACQASVAGRKPTTHMRSLRLCLKFYNAKTLLRLFQGTFGIIELIAQCSCYGIYGARHRYEYATLED